MAPHLPRNVGKGSQAGFRAFARFTILCWMSLFRQVLTVFLRSWTMTAAAGNSVTPTAPPSFQDELVALLPQLRAFARSLCGNRALADDLVQEAAIRAWGAQAGFVAGSSMKAWTFTILRNVYFSDLRKERRHATPSPDAVRDWTPAEQEDGMHIADLERALARLSPERRTALLLVTLEDFSYEEAARICDCPIGTLRSRVSRARRDLGEILAQPPPSVL